MGLFFVDWVGHGSQPVIDKKFIETVFQYLNRYWRKHVKINKELFRPSDIMKSKGDPPKANKILGWRTNVLFNDLVGKLVQAELHKTSLKTASTN